MTPHITQAFLIDRIGWLLFHSVWQFTLIAIAVYLGLRAAPGKNTALRYAICLIGLALVAVTPVFTFISSADFAAHRASISQVAAQNLTAPKVGQRSSSPGTVSPVATDSSFSSDNIDNRAKPRLTPDPAQSWREELSEALAPWFGSLVTLWCCGVMVFAVRPTWSWCNLQRLRHVQIHPVGPDITEIFLRAVRKLGLSTAPQLFESALIQVPMVVGYLKPVVLLPAAALNGLSTSQLEAILLHELAHIRRHDYLVNLAQTLLETLFFYHPGVWWVSHALRCEREHCCDEIASTLVGSRAKYGRALLRLEELRGGVPSLALGATQGSLVRRVRRLLSAESREPLGFGSIAAMSLALCLVFGLAWTRANSQSAFAKAEAGEPSKISGNEDKKEGNSNSTLSAEETAVQLHNAAAQIDTLPNFYIRANAGTRTFQPVAKSLPQPLDNLKRALDEPVVEKDWYRYEKTFAWDSQRFIDQSYAPWAYGPDQPESKSPSGNPPSWYTRWGTAEIGGERSQMGERNPFHVLRASANEMWKDNTVSNPNYLLATTHKFWWGDNSYTHQCFSSIPVELAEYRRLEAEEFDGELCDVIESPLRHERLWLSRRSGRLLGYLLYNTQGPANDFGKSDVVAEIAGRRFETPSEFGQWYRREYDNLPKAKQLQLTLAALKTHDFNSATPSLLVRFRDYREVSPGIWWPFQEDRAQGFSSDGAFQCMLSTYRVEEVRLDFNLEKAVSELQPKEGEEVQDQRYGTPVQYQYRSDRPESEIKELANLKQQEQLKDKALIAKLREPYQELIGKPAPQLPEKGWVGGTRPQLTGQPYLIHYWAAWCGPCKSDYPLLAQLAKGGAIIIGLHPAGTDASDVEKAMAEINFKHPTYLAQDATGGDDHKIAGYPSNMFPYYLLVDANGIVAAHGTLTENGAALIAKFRELRKQAGDK